ncbi:MAG: hypothetical protein RR205_05280, partial [Oscillospiraceae bacterium]
MFKPVFSIENQSFNTNFQLNNDSFSSNFQNVVEIDKGIAAVNHNILINRDIANQHPITAITGLTEELNGKQPIGNYAATDHNHDTKYQAKGDYAAIAHTHTDYAATAHNHDTKYQPIGTYLTTESDPTVPQWAKQASKPTYSASEVGALPANTTLFSGAYNDLTGKPTIPVNTSFTLLGLSEKSYNNLTDKPSIPIVSNSLTETASGKALDALQGKALDEKIGSLTVLQTLSKNTLVSAVNELVPNTITDLGVTTLSLSISANTTYNYNTLSSLTVTNNLVSPYETIILFKSGTTATNVTLPVGIKKLGSFAETAFAWKINTNYIISIMN